MHPQKKKRRASDATRAAIAAGARAAVAAGHWPAPGPLWTPAEDALLGTMSDPRVAAATGRSLGSIAARRHKLGIPAASSPGRPHGTTRTAKKS